MSEAPLWWEIIWTLGVCSGYSYIGWVIRGWIDKGRSSKDEGGAA